MRIKFAFSITQINPREVEVNINSHGDMELPRLEMVNAEKVKKDFKITDAQLDIIGEKVHKVACEQLVRESIEVII